MAKLAMSIAAEKERTTFLGLTAPAKRDGQHSKSHKVVEYKALPEGKPADY